MDEEVREYLKNLDDRVHKQDLEIKRLERELEYLTRDVRELRGGKT
jgi:hypothetical protein